LLDYQIHLPLLELSKIEALKLLDLQTKSAIDSEICRCNIRQEVEHSSQLQYVTFIRIICKTFHRL